MMEPEQAREKAAYSKDEAANQQDNSHKKEKPPLASIPELYSFGENKGLLVAMGVICAAIAGCVLPSMIFVFADSFEKIGASTANPNFLAEIRRIAFILMILG
jgi:hypothetical protein